MSGVLVLGIGITLSGVMLGDGVRICAVDRPGFCALLFEGVGSVDVPHKPAALPAQDVNIAEITIRWIISNGLVMVFFLIIPAWLKRKFYY